MKIDDTLKNALAGLQSGINSARAATGEVARLTTDNKDVHDMIKPLLDLNESEQKVAANAKVVKAADEMLGQIIDVTV